MAPRVSVIIPCYNVERYIAQTVQSVLTQTYQDLEIILVDDHSTDGTLALVRQVADRRLRLFSNPENRGPSYTRNRGIAEARGEWLAILDSDDWWADCRLEIMLKTAGAMGLDMVGDDIAWVRDGEPAPYTTFFRHYYIPWYRTPEPARLNTAQFIHYELVPLQPLMRREFIRQHRLAYREDITYGEDFVFYLECLLNGARLAVLPQAYYYRRLRAGSLTTRQAFAAQELLEVTGLLLQRLAGDPEIRPAGPERRQLTAALRARRHYQQAALRYHRFHEPWRQGDWGTALRHLAGLRGMVELAAAKLGRWLEFHLGNH